MIDGLIAFSARRTGVIFTLTALAVVAGYLSMRRMPLDALPDLSETQVIVYSRWDRSPDLIEAQVTYPIVSAMLGGPHVKSVRGISDFGASYVSVIFDDSVDIYWARSRTLEYLSPVLARLPEGAKCELGPDATGLGWVFQYALVDTSGRHNLEELRSYQDWYLRYYLKAVPGVAEVASVGGSGREYQVNVDPDRLRQFGLSVRAVVDAVRGGNSETGGRLIEFGGTEYMIRGRGFFQSARDIEETVVQAAENGAPVRVKDIGQVVTGPQFRRGITDLDGAGEVVSGIVIVRQSQNALAVIDRVKAKIREVEPGFPAGVKIVPVYDRSQLIRNTIGTVKRTLLEIVATVSIVILLFLGHVPSAIIPVITLPIALLISFLPVGLLGIEGNIMSLGGLAIAIGAMVDASIVVVEQTHKKLEQWESGGRRGDAASVVLAGIKEVAGPSFFALLVIAVSFLPVMSLEAQEGKLFKPLAYTKSIAMIVAAVLAVSLDPALRLSFLKVRDLQIRPQWLHNAAKAIFAAPIHPESANPISRAMIRLYSPVVDWSLRSKHIVFVSALLLMALSVPVFLRLGSEFMPPLDEGSLLYMPSTMSGVSIAEAQRLLQITDRVLRQFPQVERVFGKAGRAETATDPAPLSMLETVVILRPQDAWPRIHTWYSSAPEWLKPLFRRIQDDHISTKELIRQMDAALQIPGLVNAWTMPIKGRIDMLTTGLRTDLGLKIQGADPIIVQELGGQIEPLIRSVPGTRTVLADRFATGYYVDIRWRRDELARYGLRLDEAQSAVQNAIGGDAVTEMIQGRERYTVNVRYMRDYRDDPDTLRHVLVSVAPGKDIPLGQLAEIQLSNGPSMLRNDDGLLTGYVYIDAGDIAPTEYVTIADRILREKLKLPPGYSISWSGQYQAIERVHERLRLVIPLTLLLVVGLLYLNTRSVAKTMIVLLAVPFSALGAIWLVYLCGYHLSVAVWIGIIALVGVDAETGIFMLLYLDLAYEQAKREGRMHSIECLRDAVRQGAVRRIRPKIMTVATMFIGLLPVLLETGAGADVMKRIAAPMAGGIVTSFLLELIVYPAVYEVWKWHTEVRQYSTVPISSRE